MFSKTEIVFCYECGNSESVPIEPIEDVHPDIWLCESCRFDDDSEIDTCYIDDEIDDCELFVESSERGCHIHEPAHLDEEETEPSENFRTLLKLFSTVQATNHKEGTSK